MDQQSFFPVGMESHWNTPAAGQHPAALHNWLTDEGSLTEKLKALHSDFHVEVLGQEQMVAEPDEYQALNLPVETVTVREVLLWCNGTPWVFARSVMPQEHLKGKAKQVTGLGNKPLGEHLFTRKDVTPGTIEIAEFPVLSPVARLNRMLNGKSETLWGRRRPFFIGDTAILVAEVFLSPVAEHASCYTD